MIVPLRMVALDLSTAATAIAVTHDPAGAARLAVHTVAGTGTRPLHEQIDLIEMAVRRACGYGSGNQFLGRGRVDLVVIEGTFSRPGPSDYPLHALHGNVKQWLYRRQIPYANVAPSTLKVWATGGGDATKRDMVAGVLADYGRLLNINPADDNQADAVGLLSMGLAAYNQPLADVPEEQRRSLRVPSWPTIANS